MAEVLVLVPRNRIRRALKHAAMSADVLVQILERQPSSAPAKADEHPDTNQAERPSSERTS
jgi:hypothetical protein